MGRKPGKLPYEYVKDSIAENDKGDYAQNCKYLVREERIDAQGNKEVTMHECGATITTRKMTTDMEGTKQDWYYCEEHYNSVAKSLDALHEIEKSAFYSDDGDEDRYDIHSKSIPIQNN